MLSADSPPNHLTSSYLTKHIVGGDLLFSALLAFWRPATRAPPQTVLFFQRLRFGPSVLLASPSDARTTRAAKGLVCTLRRVESERCVCSVSTPEFYTQTHSRLCTYLNTMYTDTHSSAQRGKTHRGAIIKHAQPCVLPRSTYTHTHTPVCIFVATPALVFSSGAPCWGLWYSFQAWFPLTRFDAGV